MSGRCSPCLRRMHIPARTKQMIGMLGLSCVYQLYGFQMPWLMRLVRDIGQEVLLFDIYATKCRLHGLPSSLNTIQVLILFTANPKSGSIDHLTQILLVQLLFDISAMRMPTPRLPEARSSDDGNPMRQDKLASSQLSQNMDPQDLEAPMNWPLHRKIYVSAAAWLYAFAL
jgi:hypothetical protein